MADELGFPKGLISVERGIGGRRTDIVCYTKEMKPLLLVECKAVPLNEEAIQQALGYNEKMLAPFLCLANGEEIHTFWFEGKKRVSVPFLPAFKDLYAAFQRL
ncbi:MAG: type I restriction enzyme HsdR N-terminal domain-containing protein [Parachlamydiales bacterium]|nr:type I restriction enzyme HsdR N-terminal domain-containing protein [Parachlamydiales bacterium]